MRLSNAPRQTERYQEGPVQTIYKDGGWHFYPGNLALHHRIDMVVMTVGTNHQWDERPLQLLGWCSGKIPLSRTFSDQHIMSADVRALTLSLSSPKRFRPGTSLPAILSQTSGHQRSCQSSGFQWSLLYPSLGNRPPTTWYSSPRWPRCSWLAHGGSQTGRRTSRGIPDAPLIRRSCLPLLNHHHTRAEWPGGKHCRSHWWTVGYLCHIKSWIKGPPGSRPPCYAGSGLAIPYHAPSKWDITWNVRSVNSSHKNNSWLTHSYLKYNC